MTRLSALIGAVLAASALLAAPAVAVTLHVHNGGDPASLDPHKVSGDWENRIVGDMIEGLVTEDAHAKAIPGQAESWEVSEDGLAYRFNLRADAKWSDGTAVTADDFVYALRRIMNPATAAKYAYLQYPIKNAEAINTGAITDPGQLGVKALDDRTLEITLENPTPYFIQALTHYTAYPVPKHVVEAKGDDWIKIENIVVNGAYKPVEWLPGSHVKLVKNPAYYDAGKLKVDEVVYYVLEDESAALKRYRAGEFDVLTQFPTDQLAWLEENRPGEARVAPFLGLYYYVFNHTRPPFGEAKVRQALSMAINREVIGPKVLGTGEQAAYSWVVPGMDNYGEVYRAAWADLPQADKLAQAKGLLAEAGYGPDKPLKLQLRYNTNENHKRIAVAIAAMWKDLGVEVELFNTEVKVHYADLNENDFEGVARAGWLADYNDPVNFLELLKGGNKYNYGRWENAEFDALLDRAAKESDLKKRADLLAQAEKIAIDQTAAAPIYYYISRNVVSPKVTGYEDNAKDVHRTRWVTKAE
jgi:oligopeptide transport system substrate-binding protein